MFVVKALEILGDHEGPKTELALKNLYSVVFALFIPTPSSVVWGKLCKRRFLSPKAEDATQRDSDIPEIRTEQRAIEKFDRTYSQLRRRLD